MILHVLTLRALILGVLDRFVQVVPGCNGPRKVPDLPTRNTAHWLNAFAWGYTQVQKPSYLNRVFEMAEWLISSAARPYGYAFANIPEERIAGNGLIGQAWVMEALLTATELLGEPRYAQVAAEVFEQHAYDESRALWRVLHPNGTVQRIHPTLNQQIWFAAMGARLAPYGAVHAPERVQRFLDHLDRRLQILRGGLLGMRIPHLSTPSLRQRIKKWLAPLIRKQQSSGRPTFSYYEVSVGYHAFAMYGLALLYPALPHHPFWRTPKFQQALQWTDSRSHREALECNRFAMGYNPSGFEVPYVLSVLGSLEADMLLESSRWWLTEQIRRHYDPTVGQFNRNTHDAPTLTARVYEATRLPTALLDMPLHL